MADFQILVAPTALYQGQPFDIQWVIAGVATAPPGTAAVRFIVNGQTVWSKNVALPMLEASVDRVNPPADPLAAHRLYDIPPGTTPPNTVLSGIVAEITAGGQVVNISARAQVHVYPLLPVVEWSGPVNPGQPVSLSWGFDTISATEPTVVGSYATATIAFDILDEATGGFVPLQPESSAVYVQLGKMQSRLQQTLVPDDAQTAKLLYRIGNHRLRATLALTILGFSQSWTINGSISVVAVRPAADWWRWTQPPDISHSSGYLFAESGWNTPYRVGGRLVNRSPYTVFNVNVDLQETELWGEFPRQLPPPQGPLTQVASVTLPVPLQPNQDDALGDATFPQQNQDYKWLDPVTSGINPSAIGVAISYFVIITVKDSFGNDYSPTRSEQLSVNVGVSGAKLSSASAGRLVFVTAVILTAAAIVCLATGLLIPGGIMSAAASALFFIASQLVKNAMDPPAPSREYLSLVPSRRFRPMNLGADEVENGGGLMLFLRLLESLATSYETRSETLGRLMGAQADGNIEGLQLQHTSYLEQYMRDTNDVEAIPVRAREASREMVSLLRREDRPAAQDVVREWKMTGISDASKALLLESGVTAEAIAAIDAAGRNEVVANSALQLLNPPDPGSLEPSIATLAKAFQDLGRVMAAEANSVIEEARAVVARSLGR